MNFDYSDVYPAGDGTTLGIVDPNTYNCNGFHKKIEIVGVLSPATPDLGLALHQWAKGYEMLDGYFLDQSPDWTGDDGAMQSTTDDESKVFMWDAPGEKFTPTEWSKPAASTSFDFSYDLKDKAFFKGKVCSAPFFWSRRLRLQGTPGLTVWSTVLEND
jgi:hypothetical protein